MLLLVILSFITLIFIAVLHYSQHFTFSYRGCSISNTSLSILSLPTSTPDITSVRTRSYSQNKLARKRSCKRCCCVLKSIDGQQFDFFPVSFLIYIIFLSFLCVLVMIIDIVNFKNIANKENYIDLFFGYSAETYHRQSLFTLHSIQLFSDQTPFVYVLDLFLIFGIMILSVWESLFSWYRYYTTYKSAKNFRDVAAKKVIKKFIIYYALIYCIVFLIEIFVYYYTFLIVVIMHATFNILCTWKFSAFLIEKYKLFIMMETNSNDSSNNKNEEILNSVIFMKRTSILCCILQSINLCIFVIAYNPTVIYYLPILWSVSCSIFALNFIRNRMIVKQKMLTFSQFITYKYLKKPINVQTSSNTKLPNLSDKKSKSKSNNQNQLSQVILTEQKNTKINMLKRMKKAQSDRNVMNDIPSRHTLQPAKSNPVRSKIHGYLKKNKSDPHLFIDHESSINDEKKMELSNEYSYSISRKKTPRSNKALELLGIQPSNSQMSHMTNRLSLKNKLSNSIQNGDYFDIHMVGTPEMNETNDLEFAVVNNNDQKIEEITMEVNIEEPNIEPIIMTDVVLPRDNEKLDTPMTISGHKPQPSQHDVDEAMESFKLFAKYGFISNTNINSAAQIRNYNVQMQNRNSAFHTVALQSNQKETNISFGGSHSVQSRNKLPVMKRWFNSSNSLPKNSSENSGSNSNKKQVTFAMQ